MLVDQVFHRDGSMVSERCKSGADGEPGHDHGESELEKEGGNDDNVEAGENGRSERMDRAVKERGSLALISALRVGYHVVDIWTSSSSLEDLED